MKVKKIFIISIIINILSIGIIYSFIKKDYISNEKIIVKAMTGTEYENNITSLNTVHEEYANYIQACKTQIASAITDKGVPTSDEETLENMVNNIKNIPLKSSSVNGISLVHTVTSPYPNYLTDTYTFEQDYSYVIIATNNESVNTLKNATLNGSTIAENLFLRNTTPSMNQSGCGSIYSCFIPNIKAGDVFYITSSGFGGSFYDIYGIE